MVFSIDFRVFSEGKNLARLMEDPCHEIIEYGWWNVWSSNVYHITSEEKIIAMKNLQGLIMDSPRTSVFYTIVKVFELCRPTITALKWTWATS